MYTACPVDCLKQHSSSCFCYSHSRVVSGGAPRGISRPLSKRNLPEGSLQQHCLRRFAMRLLWILGMALHGDESSMLLTPKGHSGSHLLRVRKGGCWCLKWLALVTPIIGRCGRIWVAGACHSRGSACHTFSRGHVASWHNPNTWASSH